ncbi:MAG TPA: PQQ-binding-like beta-propeller repeat protein [Blastocatellia bacterium]|jgi:outer membrane protein assembly factor BamB|nr:PQQ-binding-like beta-propeller repeat protein [Blastocatellia bacterium]
MKKALLTSALLGVAAFAMASTAAKPKPAKAVAGPAANWSQWRGPGGQGVSTETGVPTEWSETRNIKWKTPIAGRGHSSPVVWGDRVFLTAAIEGDIIPGAKPPKHFLEGQEYVHPDSTGGDRLHTFKAHCFDRRTGKPLWERVAYKGRVYDDRHRTATYADATPATDGRYVYFWFGSEGLYCYDFSGKLVWKKSLGNMATHGMGNGASPVLFEDRVILQCDEDNGERGFIVALDKRDGKELWRTPRRVQMSWATPVIAHAPQRAELITSANEYILAYDPATGKELWRCKGTQSWTVTTPIVGQGIVIASAAHPVKRAVAIRLGGNGDVTDTPNVVWQRDKGTGYVPSSIVYGDYAYLMTDGGLLTCIEVKTGEVKYEGARVPIPGRFYASPVAFEDKLLLTNENGESFVVKAGPQHAVLRTNSLDEPIYASPAIAGGELFIRGTKHLYCIASNYSAS